MAITNTGRTPVDTLRHEREHLVWDIRDAENEIKAMEKTIERLNSRKAAFEVAIQAVEKVCK